MSETKVTRRGSGGETIKDDACLLHEIEVVKRVINMNRCNFDKTKAINLFFKKIKK